MADAMSAGLSMPRGSTASCRPGNLPDAVEVLRRGHLVGHLDAPAGLEVVDRLRASASTFRYWSQTFRTARLMQAVDQVVFLLVLAGVLELDLAGGGREDRVQVGEARDDLALAVRARRASRRWRSGSRSC